MRVAIMSDIHGFDLAFQAVLEDIDRNGPFDLIAVAGDLCVIGPRPDAVVRIARERNLVVVKGNTDVALVQGARFGSDDPEVRYAAPLLGDEGLSWLNALPFEVRVSPPGSTGPHDDLLIVHANPQNLTDALDPLLPDVELLRLIGWTEASMIAFGHIHICYIRQVGRFLLMDVSAVGNSKNHDLSSKWGIATWDETDRRWTAELQSVPYPLEETRAEILACGVPSAKRVIRKLEQAAYRGR
ncbi:MAG: metallophosphoesterase family protein [Thermomicrobiales bacterium]